MSGIVCFQSDNPVQSRSCPEFPRGIRISEKVPSASSLSENKTATLDSALAAMCADSGVEVMDLERYWCAKHGVDDILIYGVKDRGGSGVVICDLIHSERGVGEGRGKVAMLIC